MITKEKIEKKIEEIKKQIRFVNKMNREPSVAWLQGYLSALLWILND